MLDRVIDINYYPIAQAASSNAQWRPVGLGIDGPAGCVLSAAACRSTRRRRWLLSTKIQEEIYFHALTASVELAEKMGRIRRLPRRRIAAKGVSVRPVGCASRRMRRDGRLCASVSKRAGLRNSLVIAIAPTATIASIVGCYECIEPQISNLFKRETLSGEFLQMNRYLIDELQTRGLWTEEMRMRLKLSEGSVQKIDGLPDDLKLLYRTVWEIPMRSLIDMAAARNAYIDQSQSLNLFAESPNIGKLLQHVYVCVEEGSEDDVLSAFAAGNEDCKDYGAEPRPAMPEPLHRPRSRPVCGGRSNVLA